MNMTDFLNGVNRFAPFILVMAVLSGLAYILLVFNGYTEQAKPFSDILSALLGLFATVKTMFIANRTVAPVNDDSEVTKQ
jgi:hypothetical protein